MEDTWIVCDGIHQCLVKGPLKGFICSDAFFSHLNSAHPSAIDSDGTRHRRTYPRVRRWSYWIDVIS